jgi:hypothetical protein
MVTRAAGPERFIYARWDIRMFRGITRLSDYKKVKARMRRALGTDTNADTRQGRGRRWRSLLSDRGLVTITAVGTIALVVIGVLTLLVMLLVHA